jgi:hypothetical protein
VEWDKETIPRRRLHEIRSRRVYAFPDAAHIEPAPRERSAGQPPWGGPAHIGGSPQLHMAWSRSRPDGAGRGWEPLAYSVPVIAADPRGIPRD